MKLIVIAVSVFSLSAFAAGINSTRTTVNDKGTGSIDITLTGGDGSQAEKLYNSLAQVPEKSEGAHNGASKQVTGVFCEYLSPGTQRKASYTCVISLSYAGLLIPLEP